jgi:hypothetical protein
MSEVEQNGQAGEVAIKPHEQFIQYLAMRAESEAQTRGFEIAASQMDKLLSAEDEAALWEADNIGTINGMDAAGIEIQVHSISFAKSADEFDAPLGVYALIKAQRLSNGEEILINTGSPLIITKLYAFERAGRLPLECKVEALKIAGGNTVLKLRPIPVRAVQGSAT